MPVPGTLSSTAPRSNSLNMRFWSAGAMPMPVSRIEIVNWSGAGANIESSIEPARVYLTAFDSRFKAICLILSRSVWAEPNCASKFARNLRPLASTGDWNGAHQFLEEFLQFEGFRVDRHAVAEHDRIVDHLVDQRLHIADLFARELQRGIEPGRRAFDQFEMRRECMQEVAQIVRDAPRDLQPRFVERIDKLLLEYQLLVAALDHAGVLIDPAVALVERLAYRSKHDLAERFVDQTARAIFGKAREIRIGHREHGDRIDHGLPEQFKFADQFIELITLLKTPLAVAFRIVLNGRLQSVEVLRFEHDAEFFEDIRQMIEELGMREFIGARDIGVREDVFDPLLEQGRALLAKRGGQTVKRTRQDWRHHKPSRENSIDPRPGLKLESRPTLVSP